MCLYRNESSESYYAFVKRNGRQIRRSLETKDRKLAERRLKEFHGDADKLVSGGRKPMSFTQLKEIWKQVVCANQRNPVQKELEDV